NRKEKEIEKNPTQQNSPVGPNHSRALSPLSPGLGPFFFFPGRPSPSLPPPARPSSTPQPSSPPLPGLSRARPTPSRAVQPHPARQHPGLLPQPASPRTHIASPSLISRPHLSSR